LRITNNMMISNLLVTLQNNQNVMSKDQQILASGKKFITPSDDPIAMTKSMRLNTDIDESDQYKKNCDDAVSWLSMTEDAINKVQSVVKRANDLALQAANGTNTNTDKQAIAEEMKQLKSELVSLSNTTYAGRYMFSGFQTDQKLLNDDGTYNISVGEISSDQFSNITDMIGKAGTLTLQKEDGSTLSPAISYTAATTWGNLATQINAAGYTGVKASIEPRTISSAQFANATDAIGKAGTLVLQKEDGTTIGSIAYAATDKWGDLAKKINGDPSASPAVPALYPGVQANIVPSTGADPKKLVITSDATVGALVDGSASTDKLITETGPKKLIITSDKTVSTLVDNGGLIKNSEDIEYKVGVADTIKVNTLGTEVFGSGKQGDVPKLISDFDNYINTLTGEISTDFYAGGTITKTGTISSFTKADGTTITLTTPINYGPVAVPPVTPATKTDVTSLESAINSDSALKAAGISAKVVTADGKSRLVIADNTGKLKENSGLLQDSNVGIEQAVKDMNDNLNNISKSISQLGAKSNRAELTANRLDDENLNFTKLLTDNEDIDYEKIIMELTNNESVYNASLSIGMRVIQKSLVDFLG
jgi:flagellar hook-associated protein 3 FlgL